MGPIALLLRGESRSPNDQHLEKMLDFFAVPWRGMSIEEVRNGGAAKLAGGHSKVCVLASAESLAGVMRCHEEQKALEDLCASVASVFVYGFQPTAPCRKLLREITGDDEADIRRLKAHPVSVSIADDFAEMCGPLSGVKMKLKPGVAETAFTFQPVHGFHPAASVPEGYLFAGFVYSGVQFFVDASRNILDVRRRTAEPFDVKESFSGAVAIVMYLKWAFQEIWWTAPEINACLILDDLLLRERHGYFEYRQLFRLINKFGIAATVGFIPWNWRRTDPDTVKAIHSKDEHVSVCMHGCDHSKAEFASRSKSRLDGKLKTAKRRMRMLYAETGIEHDEVQVFPQGKFSPEAGFALKHQGLTAAVNTDPAPLDRRRNRTRIADLWSLANLRYGGFPIFSRRYITSGVENFAFDGLLGKPCLIGGHHDLFRNDCGDLTNFLDKLQALNWNLVWRPLESALCRSYSVQNFGGSATVRMYGERLVLENCSTASREFVVVKKEEAAAALKGVAIDGKPSTHESADGAIRFRVTVPAGGRAEVRCEYVAAEFSREKPDPLPYKVNIAVRRHLSVIRDACISMQGLLSRSAMFGLRRPSQWVEQ